MSFIYVDQAMIRLMEQSGLRTACKIDNGLFIQF